MTQVEIWQTLQTLRDTLIQAHVQLNGAMDQIEKLAEAVRQNIVGGAREAEKK